MYTITNLSIRPNPDGRINRKPEGQIIDETAEKIENLEAEFNETAEID